MKTEDVAARLEALGNPTRLEIEYGVEIGVKYFHASTGRFIAEERYR
jgi:hypothetical protein